MSKPVLFVSFRPLERAENIRAIYEAYQGEKVHVLSTAPEYLHEVHSGRYDLMVTDDFPKETPGKCIMIWHGIQGGKYIGLQQPIPFYSREDADKMTYIISAGTGMTDVWNRCTGVDVGRILPFGLPRTDAYIGKRKGDGHTFLAEKRSYLYVPTFREHGEPPIPGLDWEYIDRELSDDELFVIKAHPWQFYQGRTNQIPTPFKPYKHIRIVHESEPSAPYLYDADVVITDYSSIMFDAYLLNKPVVLLEKSKGYTTTRGMYLHYPFGYCSRYATNEHDMILQARLADGLSDTEYACRDLVADKCDGHACERLCRLIDKLKGG